MDQLIPKRPTKTVIMKIKLRTIEMVDFFGEKLRNQTIKNQNSTLDTLNKSVAVGNTRKFVGITVEYFSADNCIM